jgi:hypothetical protein
MFTFPLLTFAIEFNEVIYGVVFIYSYSSARDDLSFTFPMCVEIRSVIARRTIKISYENEIHEPITILTISWYCICH